MTMDKYEQYIYYCSCFANVHNNVAALVAGGVINAEVLAVRIVTVLTKT
jgi:hypothetical protein